MATPSPFVPKYCLFPNCNLLWECCSDTVLSGDAGSVIISIHLHHKSAKQPSQFLLKSLNYHYAIYNIPQSPTHNHLKSYPNHLSIYYIRWEIKKGWGGFRRRYLVSGNSWSLSWGIVTPLYYPLVHNERRESCCSPWANGSNTQRRKSAQDAHFCPLVSAICRTTDSRGKWLTRRRRRKKIVGHWLFSAICRRGS